MMRPAAAVWGPPSVGVKADPVWESTATAALRARPPVLRAQGPALRVRRPALPQRSKTCASLSARPARSLSDSCGGRPSRGHWMPIAGSFQAMHRSCWGA
jgi:hypothetical protein